MAEGFIIPFEKLMLFVCLGFIPRIRKKEEGGRLIYASEWRGGRFGSIVGMARLWISRLDDADSSRVV